MTRFTPHRQRESMVVLLVLSFNLVLVSPDLMPEFFGINPYDEAKYIESGSILWRFEFRQLAWGPLVALVYAPFHLVLGSMADWFLAEAWAGRFLLFISLWLSTFYLASKLSDYANRYVAMGVLFVNLSFFSVLANSSDAVFVIFSALALAKVLSFKSTQRMQDVWIGSAFVGLCVLSRFEAIVLIPLFLVLSLALGLRRHALSRLLPAALLPSIAILAVFILISRSSMGSYDFGVRARSYEAFQSSQPILAGGNLGPKQETERLFGTAEENRGSVLRAILRNPMAFALRILAHAMKIPSIYLSFFGKRLGPVLLLFALWGAYVLVRRRATLILAIMFLWALQPLISLGFKPLHLVPQIGYIPLILGTIGISHSLGSEVSHGERRALLLFAMLFAAYAWVDKKPAFLMGGVVLAFALGLAWLLRPRMRVPADAEVLSLLLLLAAGLILRGSYPFPDFPVIGESPEELAVHAMQARLPPRSRVLVPFPGPALAAGMKPISMPGRELEGMTADEFQEWMRSEDIHAIYLDRRHRPEPVLSQVIDAIWAKCLERGLASGEGTTRLFLAEEVEGGVGFVPFDGCPES